MSTAQVNCPDQSKDDSQVQLVVAINGGSKLSLSVPSDPKSLASALTRPHRRRSRLSWEALGSVRQTLVAVRNRLTDRASSLMTKARRFRGIGGGGGGGGGGVGSLPRRVRRVLVATAERARRRFGAGPAAPDLRESWTRETALLRRDVRRIGFWRSVVGEFLGSLFLVLIGCGAGVETDRRQEGPETVLPVALAFGATYAAGLYSLHSPGNAAATTVT